MVTIELGNYTLTKSQANFKTQLFLSVSMEKKKNNEEYSHMSKELHNFPETVAAPLLLML